ncbi:MAG: membrane protein insertase YidC [Gemmatimonadota bacterium]
MSEQRRILLAVILMMAVLVVSQWWFGRMGTGEPPVSPADTTATGDGVADPPLPDETEGRDPTVEPPLLAPPPADTAAAGPGVSPPDSQPAPSSRPIVIETPLYRLAIDPRGGTLRQIELLQHPSYTTPGPVRLVPEQGTFLARAANVGGRRIPLSALTYVPSDTAMRLGEGGQARLLRLASSEGGQSVVQTYRFDPSTYVIDYRVEFGAPVEGVLVTGLGPRLHSSEKQPRDDYGQLRGVARVDGDILTASAEELDEGDGLSVGGEIDWAGLRNKYFLAMVLAPEDGPPLSALTMRGEATDSLPSIEVGVAAPIAEGVAAHRLYLGPQEYGRLSSLNDGLDQVNQYGWSWIRWMISPFGKLIVVIMLWLHRFIPSYGLVIVVFAVLVRIVTWPLTTKSYSSIRAMQELQPEIQRIRERHKDDPQRMQQETMRLYKDRKVNPLGGCLPNLLPMPILFALFFVFQSTIEFRGQDFLWLPDLSQADPLYILPIFLGLSMMASSKLTTSDPRMAAMTYVMPIVMTFVFLNLAAGLVLYYAISNLLTFAQQWWLKTKFEVPVEEGVAAGD